MFQYRDPYPQGSGVEHLRPEFYFTHAAACNLTNFSVFNAALPLHLLPETAE